ncbi:unnamed protein product [Hymenolepis diminuta]|uniref:Ubiquitin-conjugating enzyme E2 J2 n=1 Tax=Hymenolepis diminuta TaxID=6216 RepID=A0A0R3SWV8_HYMDI|nr:unnamed protein product [Hymenolepis diminuta]VUZ46780.1 unnamed protein product [Hymenolepis diminuta]
MCPVRKGGLSVAVQRLQQDYVRLARDPIPFIAAHPLNANIFEWHYLVFGPPDSPYHGGYYHGKLVFPKEYPFRPPSIYMITPNGRFACNTRLCLSISDFHPDTWNPAWSVSTILTGLLSFMLEDTPTMGSVSTSLNEKRQLAKESLDYNLKDEIFVELFPDVVTELKSKQKLAESSSSSFSGRNGQAGVENQANGAQRGGPDVVGDQLPFYAVFVLFAIFAISVQVVLRYLGDSLG